MTKKPTTNVAASVRQRLLNLARQRKEDFNFVLQRFTAERLLYRLSRSPHEKDFILKGASLFTLWSSTPHRSTKDLDFLSRGDPEVGRLAEVFRSVCSQPVDDDGILFLADSVRAAPIRETALYEGIRVEIDARLGNVRAHQRVDVGFGDTVTPRPRQEDFPTLLKMAAPRISMYPREAVVAEKLEAMVKLGLLNSRMKDFFDLYYLAKHFDFTAQGLSQSIQATFTRRHTEVPAEAPVALTDAFAEDPTKRSQWTAFLRRSRPIDQSLDLLILACIS